MRIIILIGINDTGKSQTLNLLYHQLITRGAQSHNDRVVLGDPAQNDFSETITWNNLKIRFFTMGDYPLYLRAGIIDAANANCDLLICACSRFTATLIGYFQQHVLQFVSKTVTLNAQQQNTINATDAQTILNLI